MDKEFWFAAPKITTDNCSGPAPGGCPGGKPMNICIGTVDFPATVIVDMPATGDTLAVLNIPAQSGYILRLDDLAKYGAYPGGRTKTETVSPGYGNKGIHIKSSTLISAFYEVNGNSNAEMYVLKGKNALGTDFLVPTQIEYANNIAAYDPDPIHAVYIVATDNATQVEVTLTKAAIGHPIGTFTITLNKGQVYMLQAASNLGANHFAGSRIRVTAGEPVTVLVSDDSVSPAGKYNINGDQIVPIRLFGTKYIVMVRGGTSERAYVMPAKNGTQIYVNGALLGTYNAGQTVIVPIATDTYINSNPATPDDYPFSVYHYIRGVQAYAGAVLPPINGCTGSHDVAIFRAHNPPFYINLMVPVGAEGGFTIRYDDGSFFVIPSAWFIPLAVAPGWMVLDPSQRKSVGDLMNEGEVVKIVNSIEVFHIGVVPTVAANMTQYGYFSDYGINNASAEEVSTGWKYPSVCFGDSIQFTARGGINYEWYYAQDSLGPNRYIYLSDPFISNPVLTNIPVGYYLYICHITGPCADNYISILVEVKPGVNAFFQVDDPNGCAPHLLKIDNLTTGGGADFRWDFTGDGTYDIITGDSAFVTSYLYNNTSLSDTVFHLTLFTKNTYACTDKFSRYIYVFPEINSGFTAVPITGCNPYNSIITNTSTGNTWQYYLDFGDGTVSALSAPWLPITHLYSNFLSKDTTYNASLIATSPYHCRDTAEQNITVRSLIDARFSINKNQGCAPFSVIVNNLSTGGITSYSWDYNGDGVEDSNSSAATFTIPYDNLTALPVNKNLRLIVRNAGGCTDTLIRTIRVNPRIKANYTLPTYTGCNSLNALFTNLTTGASTIEWTFGDGINTSSTAATVSHTYTNNSNSDTIYTFRIFAESSYGCTDDTINSITINRAYADFNLDTVSGCSPLTVNISNTSIGDEISTWAWNFGDLTTSPLKYPPAKTYNNITGITQVRNLQLTVSGTAGCSSSKTVPINVFSSIDVSFLPDNPIGCDSIVVPFVSTINHGTVNKYTWNFGDNTSSNVASPSKVYRNLTSAANIIYNARLNVETAEGCKDSASTTITVRPYVNAVYTIDKISGCSPLTVDAIANQYIGITNYNWTFGDGYNPTIPDPLAHTYPSVPPGPNSVRTLRLTVSDVSGLCSDFMEKTITIYDEAFADFEPKNSSWCNPDTITFKNNSLNDSIYSWDFGNGLSSSVFEPTQIFTNSNPASSKTFIVKLDVTSNEGCISSTTTDLTVNPYIKADFYINKSEGCSPLTVNITNTSIGPVGLSYSWVFTGGAPATSILPSPPAVVFSNNTGATITRQIQLTITGQGLCTSTKTIDIDVFSEIAVNFTNIPDPMTVCDSSNVTFTPSLVPLIAATTYSWNFGDGTSGSSTGIVSQTHLYRNLNNPISAVYPVSVLAETPDGCISMVSKNVTVRPYVKSKFTIDNAAGCSPTFAVDAAAVYLPGISQYLWNFGDGFTTTGQDPLAHTYPANTTGIDKPYTITLEVRDPSGECTSTSTKDVIAYSEANSDFNPKNTSNCNPYPITFDNLSFNATSYLWDFGDNGVTSNLFEPSYIFTNLTNNTKPYRVKLNVTSNRGCTDTISTLVNVYRYVNADFAVNIVEGCSPLTVSISNNSSGGTYRWYWNSTTGAGAADYTSSNSNEVFPHIYTNTTGSDITYNLTVVAQNADGCTKMFTRQILVHSSIAANFTYVQSNACNPSDVVFTNTSFGGGSYTMNWDFGDGTSIATTTNTVNKTFTNYTTDDKTFTVIMSAASEFGCPDSHQELITVYSRVESNFNIPLSQGCPNSVTQMFNATIENTSIGNIANVYQWYIDNIPVAGAPIDKSDFTHNYQNSSHLSVLPYSIRLRATNSHGCYTEKTGTITVFEYVDARFNIMNPTGCTPLDVQFNNTSLAPAANTNYLWEYGDNTSSGESNLIHNHIFFNESRTTDKSYRIKLKVTSQNYCIDTVSAPITVYHQPLAKLFASPTSSCPPLVVNMNNSDSRGFNYFEWRLVDCTPVNSINNSLIHTYDNTNITDIIKNYTLKLYVRSNQGCWHLDSTQLNVFPKVIADFTYEPEGCSPFVPQFIDNSTDAATIYNWDFGDGGTSNQSTVFHRFVNSTSTYTDTIYSVQLIASSEFNCSDTIIKPVTVYAQPIARFNPEPVVQTFPEARVTLYSESNGKPWNYLWNFDDGKTSTSSNEIFHDFEHWGERSITLALQSKTSSCNDAITKTIIIYPPSVNAAFTVSTDRGCEPLDVQFTASASAYTEIYTYVWDFGDGTSGTGATPFHVYENGGLYYVKMTAKGEGGEDYEFRTIRVYKNPIANFAIAPKLGMLNEQLQARIEYFNQSECTDTLGCDYLWNFGDGNTSTEREGVYYYTERGTYDVSLVITTSLGCKDSLMHENEVTIIGEGQIKFPNAFTPNMDGPIGCRTDEGYDVYSNDIFFPVYKGVIKYELLIFNRWGELIFTSNDVDCGWDGYVDGNLAKQDVYIWKAMGKFTNGRAFEIAGDVTLIR